MQIQTGGLIDAGAVNLMLALPLHAHLEGLASAEHELEAHQQVYSQLDKAHCSTGKKQANGFDSADILCPCRVIWETF